MKLFRKPLRVFALACLMAAIAVSAIAVDGLRDQVVDADLVVVPGNTVAADGTPSPRLRGRLDRALALFGEGRCRAILVSGGVDAAGFDEARVMRDYLVAHGVPAAQVFTDSHGENTFATARETARLMRERHFERVLPVSQFFHISRFRLALQKHGIEPVGHAHARYFEARDAYSLLREAAGYVAYAVKPGAAPARP